MRRDYVSEEKHLATSSDSLKCSINSSCVVESVYAEDASAAKFAATEGKKSTTAVRWWTGYTCSQSGFRRSRAEHRKG
jgi:hypothetical protein